MSGYQHASLRKSSPPAAWAAFNYQHRRRHDPTSLDVHLLHAVTTSIYSTRGSIPSAPRSSSCSWSSPRQLDLGETGILPLLPLFLLIFHPPSLICTDCDHTSTSFRAPTSFRHIGDRPHQRLPPHRVRPLVHTHQPVLSTSSYPSPPRIHPHRHVVHQPLAHGHVQLLGDPHGHTSPRGRHELHPPKRH